MKLRSLRKNYALENVFKMGLRGIEGLHRRIITN